MGKPRPLRRTRSSARAPARNDTPSSVGGPGPGATAPVGRWLRLLVGGLLVLTVIAQGLWAGSESITSADLWWTMASGRHIVEQRAIPERDVFSYTYEGAPWFNQEWLTQVLFYTVFTHLGPTVFGVLKLTLTAAVFLVAAWVGWLRGGSLAAATALVVATSVVARPFLDFRPQLLGFLNTVVLLALIELYRRGARPRLLLAVPVLMALWVNLHASFLYGLGVLFLYAGGELLKAWRGLPDRPMTMARARWLGVAALAGALACLASHQPLEALRFPFRILEPGDQLWRTEIIEWMPPTLFQELPFNPAAFGYLLVGQAAVAVLAAAAAPRRFDPVDAAHVLVTAAMALSARRFVPLFAIVAIPFGARNLAVLGERVAPRLAGFLSPRRGLLAVLALSALALGDVSHRLVRYARENYREGLFPGLIYEQFFPRQGVDFLRMNPLPGRLYSLYTWNAYVLFQLPGTKVFVDGRAHQVYPGEMWREHRTAEYGEPGWEEVLDRREVAVVLWPSGAAGGKHKLLDRHLRASSHWVCVYDDVQAAVFAHVERGRPWIDAYRTLGLRYPETVRGQLFLAKAYLDAQAYERARAQLVEVLRRFPEARKITTLGEQQYLELTRRADSGAAWFGVGLYRDVNGSGAAAADAYRRALALGLGAPQVAYAEDALRRLEGAEPGD